MNATALLLLLIVLWSVLDVLTTLWLVRHGGRELNQPLAWLMGRFGVPEALLVVKIGLVLACWIYREHTPAWALALVVAITATAVLWNVHQIWKSR